jgi:hypothetical protein
MGSSARKSPAKEKLERRCRNIALDMLGAAIHGAAKQCSARELAGAMD